MVPGTDSDVIRASLDDPAAFGVLYDRHATTVHRYLVRRVGPGDAESLLGEVFRIAFERRATYDCDRSAARPWLYGIATNVVARHRRTEARRLHAISRLAHRRDAEDDGAQRVADAVTAQRLLPEVLDAIAALPDGERDALLLHVWEDLSYDDVAGALGVPVGTVRSRLNRARGRLRDLADVAAGQRPDRVLPDHPVHAAVFTAEKERLMASIADRQQPAPAPTLRMYPRLAYRDVGAALEWLTRVFGFTERREARMDGDDGRPHLVWLEFGDGLVMISRPNEDIHQIHSPLDLGNTTSMINVEVPDIDGHHARAVAAGADITMDLEDAFYGSRRYEATDLEGHRWHFEETFASIRARGGDAPDA
jgi:RNA polymerase sigma-70 factor (ECF subfamily)